MSIGRRKTAVDAARTMMRRMATVDHRARAVMERTGHELVRAAEAGLAIAEAKAAGVDTTYDGSYFGEGRDSTGDRQGRSGYARYDRIASNADIAGWLLWRNFRVHRSLDVGCATGYLVEVLRERGIDAEGCDVSPFAVEHATPGARGHLRVGNLFAGLPWDDATFDLVTALETLEHLPPDRVAIALAELRRVCGGYLYATIPSFGYNLAGGPDGHFDGKVIPDRLDYYQSLPDDFEGPVPFADLAVDGEGEPVEGHLTIASFGWWGDRFADAGFIRCPDVERLLYQDIAPAGLGAFWNLYVLRVPEASEEVVVPIEPDRTLAELGLRHPLLGTEESESESDGLS